MQLQSKLSIPIPNRPISNTNKNIIRLNAVQTKYDIIYKIAKDRNWKIIQDIHSSEILKCNLHWIDVPEIFESFKKVLPYQKINHIPGMLNVARKSRLAKNIERMRKEYPNDYDFCPKTWILPSDWNDFQILHFNNEGKSKKFFIIKPDASCQGRGVYLTKDINKINKNDIFVAQKYITNPFLIENKKFDLRIYILITNVLPLKIYLFKDGLVRMCTTDYVIPNNENIDKKFMHLTNYAINKLSDNFEKNKDGIQDGIGSKRSLNWFFNIYLNHLFGIDKINQLWEQIADLAIKTIISIQPLLVQEYKSTFAKNQLTKNAFDHLLYKEKQNNKDERIEINDNTKDGNDLNNDNDKDKDKIPDFLSNNNSCSFAILGLDVLLDHKLKPWLLEVNHLPSFATDSPLDFKIKEKLINQTIDLLNIKNNDEEIYDNIQTRITHDRLYNNNNNNNNNTNHMKSMEEMNSTIKGGRKNIIKKYKVINNNQNNKDINTTTTTTTNNNNNNNNNIESEMNNNVNIATNSKIFDKEMLFKLVFNFYEKYNPEKKQDIEKIIEKYYDKQDELNKNIKLKYGMDLNEYYHMFISNNENNTILSPEIQSNGPYFVSNFNNNNNNNEKEQEDNENEKNVPEIKDNNDNNANEYININIQEEDDEKENLIDYIRIYPPSKKHPGISDYKKLLLFSQKCNDEQILRLQAPLYQQRKVNNNDENLEIINTRILPQIKGSKRFSSPDSMSTIHLNKIPTPEQVEAANRLMHGRSSIDSSVSYLPDYLLKLDKKKNSNINKDKKDYGIAYRERLQGIKNKPLLNMTQITFGNINIGPIIDNNKLNKR